MRSVTELSDVIKQLEEKAGEAGSARERGMTAIADLPDEFSALKPYFENALIRLYNWFVSFMKDLLAEIRKQFPGLTAPFTLYDRADRWKNEVRSPANHVAGKIVDTHDLLDYWKGPAADKYKEMEGRQGEAATRVGQLADLISDTLKEVGHFGITYLGATVVAFVVILYGAIASLLAMIGGITAPFGTVSMTTALTTFGGWLVTVAGFLWFQRNASSKLAAEVDNPAGFSSSVGGVRWPKATKLSTDVNPHKDPNDPNDDGTADWRPQHPKN
jgi:hypothetical protein